jgi:hypothetical protein
MEAKMEANERRHDHDRVQVEIAVSMTSILSAQDATIINMNENGALLHGVSARPGSRIQLEYQGQTVFAIVAWSEDDRLGARFPFGLHDGPLHQRLLQARMVNDVTSVGTMPLPRMRSAQSGFGRRRA